MADWSPNFCLACDRQTDAAAYCSEGCRLAEYERANAGSEPSSPATTTWPAPARAAFHLPSAYDFAQRPRTRSHPATPSRPVLTPSSSQSSLFSMQSSTSSASSAAAAAAPELSDEARRELRAYASAFDRSRCQRRQSAH